MKSDSWTRHDELCEALKRFDVHFNTGATKSETNTIDELNDTPVSLVSLFYEMGTGEFPESTDGMFVPPPQGAFADKFYEINKRKDGDLFTEKYRDAWELRARRAWPSLVRDVQFHFFAKQYVLKGVLDSVKYKKKRDVEDGVDADIKYKGTEFQVDLFLESTRSRKFYNKKKNSRGHDKSNPQVELPIGMYDSKNKNIQTKGEELWLYSEDHLEELIGKFEGRLMDI